MVQDVDALDSPTPDEIQETGREIWPKLNSGGTEDMQPNHCKMTDNAVQAGSQHKFLDTTEHPPCHSSMVNPLLHYVSLSLKSLTLHFVLVLGNLANNL